MNTKTSTSKYLGTMFDCLREFENAFGGHIDSYFTPDLVELRHTLIEEEAIEVLSELDFKFEPIASIYPDEGGHIQLSHYEELPPDPKKLTKELADLLYVTIGTAVTFGLPLEEVFYEVHRSNMSKLGDDGKPIYREDGKVLKGPNYKEPDLDQFFSR